MQHLKVRFISLVFILPLLCITSAVLLAQVSISPNNTPPDSSAMLDIQSTSGGLLIPRMDSVQRHSISNPAEGLLVFDTDSKSFWYRQDSMWTELSNGKSGLQDADRDTKILVEKTPDDDRIQFLTRDSLIMVIDSSGRIGIGDTLPGEALSIYGGNILQTPRQPRIVGKVGIGNGPQSLYVSGQYAYVVDAAISDDLKIVDISDPKSPEVVGNVGIGSASRSVFVSGRYAYVVDAGSKDLKIIDVSKPSSPVITGTIGLGSGSNPQALQVSGHYAYVVDAGSVSGLKIVDVANPSAPLNIGNVTFGSFPISLYLFGGYAYVVDANSGEFTSVDVSDPTVPTIVASLSLGVNLRSIYVSGRYAYVLDYGEDDIKVVDVSDPAIPVEVGNLMIGSSPQSIFVSGRYAYVTDGGSKDLKQIDVSKPASPMVVGSIGLGFDIRSVFISGRYAYVVDVSTSELIIIDISGAELTSLVVHSIETGNLQVKNDIIAQGQLQINAGLNIGSGGVFSEGSIASSGNITSTGKLIQVKNGNQTISLSPKPSEGYVNLDVGGTGHSSDHIILGEAGGGNLNKVGIGTNNPGGVISSALLEVNGGHIALANAYGLLWNNNAGTSFGAGIDSGPNDQLDFWTGGIQRATITGNGNVGIGLTNPGTRLHLSGADNDGTTGTLKVMSGSQSILMDGNEIDAVNSDLFLQNNTTDDVIMGTGGGKVAIGTSTSRTLLTIRGPNDINDGPVLTLIGTNADQAESGRIRFIEGTASTNWRGGYIHLDGSANRFHIGVHTTSDNDTANDLDAITINRGNGQVGIGTPNPTQLLSVNGTAGKPGGGSWSSFSDRRLKQKVREYKEGLSEVIEIRPVKYQYNEKSGHDTSVEHIGVIAQELEKIVPHMVSTFEKDGEEYLQVDNSAMTYMLINAVKDLKAENDQLKTNQIRIKAELIELKALLQNQSSNHFPTSEK